jgi:transcriptional regulator with XRE-family HTH domain
MPNSRSAELTQYGARIRELRERRKMTQTEFADLAGVTVRAQRNYEAGLRTPNLDYLSALAAHRVDIGYILTGNNTDAAKAALLAPYAPAFHWLAETVGLSIATGDRIAAIFDAASHYPSEGPDWGALQQISAENCIGQIDASLLAEILSAIDNLAPSLPTRKKAGIASLLYRAFRASGQIDPRTVKDAVDLAS